MNVDSLINEKSKASVWSNIKGFILLPKIFTFSIMLMMIVISFVYVYSFYESCNGTVVRGFIGLECIEVK